MAVINIDCKINKKIRKVGLGYKIGRNVGPNCGREQSGALWVVSENTKIKAEALL
jgi:hypothetical protein